MRLVCPILWCYYLYCLELNSGKASLSKEYISRNASFYRLLFIPLFISILIRKIRLYRKSDT